MTRVLIAADDDLMRAGLVELLTVDPTIEVVGEAATGRQAVEGACRFAPDVVLMDVRMPDLDGIEATRVLASEAPDVRILILTTFEQGHPPGRRPSGPAAHPRAGRPSQPPPPHSAGERGPGADSTRPVEPRDRFRTRSRGATARTHVKRILMKLNLRDRVQAVIFAYENGLNQQPATRAAGKPPTTLEGCPVRAQESL